ncbi:MAG TPA: sigma-70 family RNA polymerase sigma factor [Pyrinomonadaceae bacterium]|nr:sigma-70 family RNA polymerase sigma factor [Pyrinomonadaceae bacterium]
MPTAEPQRLTQLLVAWSDGDQQALNELFPLVYDELRQLARRHMRRERRGHTLRTTALVNDAYLRLVDQRQVRWQNRAHFFAIAAQMMRRILVDHARAKHYEKRGGGAAHVPLEEAAVVAEGKAGEILALDEALKSLAEIDPRRARVVELRYFGGLSNEEIAEVLKVSTNTVTRDWNMARAWLYHELSGGGGDTPDEPDAG